MSTGVLMYCFDTPHTAYHRIAEQAIALIKKNLRLPVTLVTDQETYNSITHDADVDYKIIKKLTPTTSDTFEDTQCLGTTWNEPEPMSIHLMTVHYF